ncbi:hypothetical protein H4R21_007101 [Coemansia helicoidea]|uniref:Uncharacterized protein n=1 Tax=Coemansia helicoidea TaxID=1286919 RepID=A0ACC1KD61_9FUNG|nr:hypothetical protein H4R21_007101 [Coemansia helicoidea]
MAQEHIQMRPAPARQPVQYYSAPGAYAPAQHPSPAGDDGRPTPVVLFDKDADDLRGGGCWNACLLCLSAWICCEVCF